MTYSDATWPDPDAPGLRIGDAAGLLQITPNAIRVYHQHGLLPEPDRDESGYRRYDARTLVVLGRITRLRAIGLSLRAIRPLLTAQDGGAALRAALRDLDETLADDIEKRQRRRLLISALHDERIEDPLEVSVADAAEERATAFLRRMIPGLAPEEEAFQRRLHRALAAFTPPGVADAAAQDSTAVAEEDLLAATGGREAFVDRFRRLFALREADLDDPRLDALAADMPAVMRTVVAQRTAGSRGSSPAASTCSAHDLERWAAGLDAALHTLSRAVRRVWELVFTEMFTVLTDMLDGDPEPFQRHRWW